MTSWIGPEECRTRAYELRQEAVSEPTAKVAERLLMLAEEYDNLAVATEKFERRLPMLNLERPSE